MISAMMPAVFLMFTAICLIISSAKADEPDRAKAALPALVEQRNAALDAAALCQGDIVILKQQLAAVQAELDKLKAESPKK